jgi:hypothetical protein
VTLSREGREAVERKSSKKVVRSAVNVEAVKLLRDNPTVYFEKERHHTMPFGFAVGGSSKDTKAH